jgi:hypothetical protein
MTGNEKRLSQLLLDSNHKKSLGPREPRDQALEGSSSLAALPIVKS